MTPDEWVADLEANTAELQRNVVEFSRNLEMAFFSKPSSVSAHLR